jgi:4-hydroxy-3-methylbut-2-enyl diphosphate reductase
LPRLEIYLPKAMGFCAGVTAAVALVRKTLEEYGPPVFVHHAIVHNERVTADLQKSGARFINGIDELPLGVAAPLILSAHGSPPALIDTLEELSIRHIDAVCPLVRKIHEYVREKRGAGYEIAVIGNSSNHQEVLGILGQIDSAFFVPDAAAVAALPLPSDVKIAYVSQTTLSEDETCDIIAALRRKFKHAEGQPLGNICRATSDRQRALRELIAAHNLDSVLIIGSPSSSNTGSLKRVALQAGATRVKLISRAEDIEPKDAAGTDKLALTAGASTPQELIDEVITRLGELAGGAKVIRWGKIG